MTPTLVLCSSCSRHFRLREPACPFCGAAFNADSLVSRRVVSLPPGASRSRRYAASAALLGSTMAACSGTTTGTSTRMDGGSGGELATDSGGTSAGGTSAGGASAGGASSGGRNAAGAGGLGRAGSGAAAAGGGAGASAGGATSGGARGSGGALGRGGAAGASHTCAGTMNPPGVTLCRSSTDCTGFGGIGPPSCVMAAPSGGCGRPNLLPHQCMVDTDCPTAGTFCQTGSCGETTCVPACSPQSCAGTNECVGTKCMPKRCDAAGGTVCGKGYTCKPADANADATGCAIVHCGDANPCMDGYDCTTTGPGNGCVQRTCAADPDCSCGYCVNGRCEPTLGFCYAIVATPYGCVWPDEELV